jgi:hypothetical protein
MKKLAVSLSITLAITFTPSAYAVSPTLPVAPDHIGGYQRALFPTWKDVLHDGCTARKEVLIAEAVVPPKIGSGCFLIGGEWIDPYSGRTLTKYSQVQIDHLVPLAEVWRSGGYAWTAAEREYYANDIYDPRTLIAVSGSLNEQKSDSDIANWQPPGGYMAGCNYVKDWIAVKLRYSLTVDPAENAYLQTQIKACKITDIKVNILPGFGNPAAPKINLKKKSSIKK